MDTTAPRTPYASDVSDEEWAFLAPCFTLMREDAPERTSVARAIQRLAFHRAHRSAMALHAHDLPPWEAVYQQTFRWLAAEVSDAIITDLRELIRLGDGRTGPAQRSVQPSAVIMDSRTLLNTPESGFRAGSHGAKRKKATKVH